MTTALRNTILTGDALEHLRTLPDASVDSIVTSPPYFRLRNYGSEGQFGLETNIDAWLTLGRLRECHRVSCRPAALDPRRQLQHPHTEGAAQESASRSRT